MKPPRAKIAKTSSINSWAKAERTCSGRTRSRSGDGDGSTLLFAETARAHRRASVRAPTRCVWGCRARARARTRRVWRSRPRTRCVWRCPSPSAMRLGLPSPSATCLAQPTPSAMRLGLLEPERVPLFGAARARTRAPASARAVRLRISPEPERGASAKALTRTAGGLEAREPEERGGPEKFNRGGPARSGLPIRRCQPAPFAKARPFGPRPFAGPTAPRPFLGHELEPPPFGRARPGCVPGCRAGPSRRSNGLGSGAPPGPPPSAGACRWDPYRIAGPPRGPDPGHRARRATHLEPGGRR